MRRPLAYALMTIPGLALAWEHATIARAAMHRPTPIASDRAASRAESDSMLWMEMRNVDLHINPRSAMHVRSLRGQVLTKPGTVAWLDDPASFRIRATSGEVALDGDAISGLLNDVAFNYPGAPITNLRVTIENGSVVQRGTLHKGVAMPFQMWSVPSLQLDGRLRLHPDKLKILGVNGLALMHALGLHMDRMMDLSKARGVSVKGDDLYLEPLAILPNPVVEGRLKSVRVEGPYMVQEFFHAADDTLFGTFVVPDSGSHNFVYFRGGTLRFGRLTMTDTDLLIHDADERDPFDLYFPEYNKQLVAGHTGNLPNLGLRTWMVDYGKLGGREKTIARR
ncbi:MAG TPA: hypothetical protein VJT85_00915 [Gemmatimonadaceae bacterium]|nr:hypothetical protein [Gemmatimonadaceae bacterium]